jgi:bifunctional non-homologous end joining protein LigD
VTGFQVSHGERVVFPEVNRTKGDVVAYYQRIAERALPHVIERPMSIRRYPKGLLGPGFFQKNVPAHFPESIGRFAVPRHARRGEKRGKTEPEVTVYPIVREAWHLPYLANQGAIELHVPTARAPDLYRPDRLILDLDPPDGALALVRRAAHEVREALLELGVATVPMATGSKGYHVVAAIRPALGLPTLAMTMQKLAALLVARHPDDLTTVFRVAGRGGRVFVDWLRNLPNATGVAPYSLRARPRATVATPLEWNEVETTAPDAFTIDDLDRLLDRPDPIAAGARDAADAGPFVAAVDAAFAASGLVLETFDRFRS